MGKSVQIHLFMFFAIFVNCALAFSSISLPIISKVTLLSAIALVGIFPFYQSCKKTPSKQQFLFDGLFSAYILINALSIIWASNLIAFINGFIFLILIFIFYFLIKFLLFRYPSISINSLISVVALSTIFYIFYMIYGLIQIPNKLALYGAPDMGITNETIYLIKNTTGIHKNVITSFFIICLPFILLGILHFKKKWRPLFYVLMSVSVFYILIFQSRSSYMALVIFGALIFLMGTQIKLFFKNLRPIIISLIFSGILFMGFILLMGNLNEYVKRLNWNYQEKEIITEDINQADTEEIIDEPKSSNTPIESKTINERFVFWSKTMSIIKKNPILGIGLSNWAIHLPGESYSGLERYPRSSRTPSHPHNDFLLIWSELGILGILLFLAMGLTLLFFGVKSFLISQSPKQKLKIAICLAGIVSYTLIFCFTGRKVLLDQQFLFFSLAALLIYYSRKDQAKWSFNIPPIALLGLAIPALLLCIIVQTGQIYEEPKLRKLSKLHRKGKSNQLIQHLQDNPIYFHNSRRKRTIDAYLAKAYFDIDSIDMALNKYEEALKIKPYYYPTITNYANALLSNQQTEKALKQYTKALYIFPEYDAARIGYTKALITNKNWKKARKNMKLIQNEGIRKELAKEIKRKRPSKEN